MSALSASFIGAPVRAVARRFPVRPFSHLLSHLGIKNAGGGGARNGGASQSFTSTSSSSNNFNTFFMPL